MNQEQKPSNAQAALGAIRLILAVVTIFYCIKLFMMVD